MPFVCARKALSHITSQRVILEGRLHSSFCPHCLRFWTAAPALQPAADTLGGLVLVCEWCSQLIHACHVSQRLCEALLLLLFPYHDDEQVQRWEERAFEDTNLAG